MSAHSQDNVASAGRKHSIRARLEHRGTAFSLFGLAAVAFVLFVAIDAPILIQPDFGASGPGFVASMILVCLAWLTTAAFLRMTFWERAHKWFHFSIWSIEWLGATLLIICAIHLNFLLAVFLLWFGAGQVITRYLVNWHGVEGVCSICGGPSLHAVAEATRWQFKELGDSGLRYYCAKHMPKRAKPFIRSQGMEGAKRSWQMRRQ